ADGVTVERSFTCESDHACTASRARADAAIVGGRRPSALLPVAKQDRRHDHLPPELPWAWLGTPQRPAFSRPQLHYAGLAYGAPERHTGLPSAAGALMPP